jgi:hypothetical protein
MAEKTRTLWVIFAGPEQIGRPGTRYIALDGMVTKEKKLAAKFVTYGEQKSSRNPRTSDSTAPLDISVMTISRTQIPKTQRGRQNPDDGHHDLKFNERYHLFGLILFNHSDDELPLRHGRCVTGVLGGFDAAR